MAEEGNSVDEVGLLGGMKMHCKRIFTAFLIGLFVFSVFSLPISKEAIAGSKPAKTQQRCHLNIHLNGAAQVWTAGPLKKKWWPKGSGNPVEANVAANREIYVKVKSQGHKPRIFGPYSCKPGETKEIRLNYPITKVKKQRYQSKIKYIKIDKGKKIITLTVKLKGKESHDLLQVAFRIKNKYKAFYNVTIEGYNNKFIYLAPKKTEPGGIYSESDLTIITARSENDYICYIRVRIDKTLNSIHYLSKAVLGASSIQLTMALKEAMGGNLPSGVWEAGVFTKAFFDYLQTHPDEVVEFAKKLVSILQEAVSCKL